MNRVRHQLSLLLAVVLSAAPQAWACSVCYGEPESPMSRGLTWAVVVLAGMIGLVLVAVSAFFIHVSRRANHVTTAAEAKNSCS